MAKKLVCLCNLIDEHEINSVLKKGADSTKMIQIHTKAGTSCGRCLPQIDEMVSIHIKKQLKDKQKKLNF